MKPKLPILLGRQIRLDRRDCSDAPRQIVPTCRVVGALRELQINIGVSCFGVL